MCSWLYEYLRPWQTRTHCCGHIVAVTNVSPFARARNICCGPKFCVRDTKMFLILFRNILCPQQMFPSLRSPRNIMDNNVSATMCLRLPGPLGSIHFLEGGVGRRNSGEGHLPAQKGRVSINLTQQRGGSLKFIFNVIQSLYKLIFEPLRLQS